MCRSLLAHLLIARQIIRNFFVGVRLILLRMLLHLVQGCLSHAMPAAHGHITSASVVGVARRENTRWLLALGVAQAGLRGEMLKHLNTASLIVQPCLFILSSVRRVEVVMLLLFNYSCWLY